ncbi:LysR family transcriptional regulator [Solirhodobacter olei]|uniref:LysR family transcriptional regulator n=1 Tax=Solirhodobacter olei TaxID=2493082 RepID=UPI000FD8FBF6|nr:LysR family transcriptional regulator [Solirhodobacter olei]
MQIELLDTFLDLLETRSFHRTAERLGVTQSTVSARIHSLETALGRRLFIRSRSGTSLTTEGLKFEPHARSLRREWRESLRAVRLTAASALSLRIGMPQDVAALHLGRWVPAFRQALPQTSFYIELDFSVQICADIVAGVLDLGVIFTPQAQPDLHFETLGELTYRLVSTETESREGLTPETHIRSEYSPALGRLHDLALPGFADPPLASGQSAVVAELLLAMGGSAFLLEETASRLIAEGRVKAVRDVAPIAQPVYAAMHVKNRPGHVHRRLLAIVRERFSGGSA